MLAWTSAHEAPWTTTPTPNYHMGAYDLYWEPSLWHRTEECQVSNGIATQASSSYSPTLLDNRIADCDAYALATGVAQPMADSSTTMGKLYQPDQHGDMLIAIILFLMVASIGYHASHEQLNAASRSATTRTLRHYIRKKRKW